MIWFLGVNALLPSSGQLVIANNNLCLHYPITYPPEKRRLYKIVLFNIVRKNLDISSGLCSVYYFIYGQNRHNWDYNWIYFEIKQHKNTLYTWQTLPVGAKTWGGQRYPWPPPQFEFFYTAKRARIFYYWFITNSNKKVSTFPRGLSLCACIKGSRKKIFFSMLVPLRP